MRKQVTLQRTAANLLTFKGLPMQSFDWAVAHNAFHARVGSIPAVFAAAAVDLGRSSVTAEVVRAVWNKLLPGLLTVRKHQTDIICSPHASALLRHACGWSVGSSAYAALGLVVMRRCSYQIRASIHACLSKMVVPALRQDYDSLWSLPAIAPRPLLIANGALDPRCPVRHLAVLPKNSQMAACV